MNTTPEVEAFRNWLITALELVHWFNPLVWIGFAPLRADRELACDEPALLQSVEASGHGYGATVVKLPEQIHSTGTVPGGVGILEDRNQMQRRIRMIAAFRRQGGWSAPAIVLLALLGAVALTDAQTPKPKPKPAEVRSAAAASSGAVVEPGIARLNLKGTIEARDGEPFPSPAMVFIRTAAPRTGTSPLCPSCYPDCSKSTKTAPDGSFTLEGLSSQLKFEVLAVAKGFKPKSKSGVDPSSGPLDLSLDPIESAEMRPDRSLRGRVVDPQGKPIRAAAVEMVGVQSRNGGGGYGQIAGFDPLAVTDENGEFVLTGREAFDRMTVQVQARGFAPKRFPSLASGGAQNSLTVTEGVTIRGRILGTLSGLQGVAIGACGTDRSVEVFLGHYEVGTGKDGVFELTNLPANGDYYVYSLMKSMDGGGGVPLQKTHAGADGTTSDLGDLKVVTGFSVVGRVELSDGSKLPPNTRVMIGRDLAWDSMQASADEQGRFEFRGIPGETVSLSIRRRGWKLSESNASLDLLNPFSLVGRVDSGCTNLVVKLEPGEAKFNRQMPPAYDFQAAKEAPLRGSEATRPTKPEWKISGRVLDQDTGKPITQFKITPGSLEPWGRFRWDSAKAFQGERGEFALGVQKDFPQPALKVESEGYLSGGGVILLRDNSAMEFRLKKGSGPKGRLLRPDGKPASGVVVALTGRGGNWINAVKGELLRSYEREDLLETTDEDGRFEFAPEFEATHVLALSRDGFAMAALGALATQADLQLKPFGKIRGTVKVGGQWLTNAELDIAFAESTEVSVNGLGTTTTDGSGKFEFDRVPAEKILLTRRQYQSRTVRQSWSNGLLKEVDMKPAGTLDLEIDVEDRPADGMITGTPPPIPKKLPGLGADGIVLNPDGKPAANAQVALQVTNTWVAVGRGSFTGNGRENDVVISADASGKFHLPMFEGARSLIALNEQGIAHVTLDSVRRSGKIQLEKWGEVHGTLMLGSKVRPMHVVHLEARHGAKPSSLLASIGKVMPGAPELDPLTLDFSVFQATTDAQGEFVLPFVPPTTLLLQDYVPTTPSSGMWRVVQSLVVRPGETVTQKFGSEDRIVSGRCLIPKDPALKDLARTFLSLRDIASARFLARWSAARSDEERERFAATADSDDAMGQARMYTGGLNVDGTFRFEGVSPGTYEIQLRPFANTTADQAAVMPFTATRPVVIPAASTGAEDVTVDLGTLELKRDEPKEETRR